MALHRKPITKIVRFGSLWRRFRGTLAALILCKIVRNERKHGNKLAKRTIDRNPSENGQELTGLVEGSCPYRYKTGGWRVRCRWSRMHDSRSFHCAFMLRTDLDGLRRKNSLKDRSRLADRKEEDPTKTESRSFGQKVTVVRSVRRLTTRRRGTFSAARCFFITGKR